MIKQAAILLVKFYRLALSPLSPPTCRFHPTCSGYALEAIERHGAFKGVFLAIIRISKCHPWYKKTFQDPVPEAFAWISLIRYKRGGKQER
ncbi:MAG: membrane protein insertion efficiency factor YidD [Alphaproteobacteria bacterium]